MKKTKVVCTMGPNTNDRELMRKLIENGMDVARFNFSHGDHEEQKGRMDLLKELRAELHTDTAILLDTKGPEIRTGVLKDGKKIMLQAGDQFTLTVDEIVGDKNKVSITYEGLVEDVDTGKVILIDDGLIELKVVGKTDRDIICEVVNGGELGEKKGVNVPNVKIKLPALIFCPRKQPTRWNSYVRPMAYRRIFAFGRNMPPVGCMPSPTALPPMKPHLCDKTSL